MRQTGKTVMKTPQFIHVAEDELSAVEATLSATPSTEVFWFWTHREMQPETTTTMTTTLDYARQ